MILTVTLNCTIDRTYTVEDFRVDRVHQAQSVNIVPGGKGINVGRVFQELGSHVLLTGFVGGHNGDYIRKVTRSESLVSDFVRIDGESRICAKIVDPVNRTQTEINEIGPQVTADDVERFLLKFQSIVPGVEYVTLSGSIPPGAPDDIYRQLIQIARRYEVKCLLDASGPPLSEGIKAFPSIVKPNVHELSELTGRQLATVEEAAEAARQIISGGIEMVVVTFGRDGAIAVTADEIWRAVPPAIQFVSAVGSGDAFAAGLISALIQGRTISDALKLGTAAGTANASTPGSGFCRKDDIFACADQTEVTLLGDAEEVG